MRLFSASKCIYYNRKRVIEVCDICGVDLVFVYIIYVFYKRTMYVK